MFGMGITHGTVSPMEIVFILGGESLYSTTLGFKFLFKRFVLAMKFTVMLFERLVTCARLVNIIATFKSPFLVDGSRLTNE